MVEGGWECTEKSTSTLFRLVYYPLEPINHVLLVLITLKHVESVQDELILILYQLLKDLDILRILEMLSG